jgi:small subunit ribosomal protein S7
MKAHLTLFEPPESGPVFDPALVEGFINCLMRRGAKGTAVRVFSRALDQIRKYIPDADPIEVCAQAVERVKPTVEFRSLRVGGATYQVPMQVEKTRQQSLAIRWIIRAARNRKGRRLYLRLAEEIMTASGCRGLH